VNGIRATLWIYLKQFLLLGSSVGNNNQLQTAVHTLYDDALYSKCHVTARYLRKCNSLYGISESGHKEVRPTAAQSKDTDDRGVRIS